jgi:hypothetical protein
MATSQSNKMLGLIGFAAGTAVCLTLVSVVPRASAVVTPHDPPVAARIARTPSYDHTYSYPSYEPQYEVVPVEQTDCRRKPQPRLAPWGASPSPDSASP